jgi:hypothetical protein
MKPSNPAKLLRWYPRACRERSGEEFLAVVEDSLDGRRPSLRLRTGGWPKIRRRVARAAGATAMAGGALTALILVPGAETYDQLDKSGAYILGLAVTSLLLAVVPALWISVVTATARHLGLSSRVRAAEKVLAAVTAAAVSGMVYVNILWISAMESSASWLIFGLAGLTVWTVTTTFQLRLAVRRGRRLRSAPGRGR